MSRIYDLLSKDNSGRTGAPERPGVPPEKPAAVSSVFELPEKTAAVSSVFELPEMLIDRDSESLKEFRTLMRNILILGGNSLSSLLVCSAGSKSGASTVAMNLSILMARELDPPCLLAEANLFSPSLYRYQKGRPCDGLCQMLEEQRPVENYVLPTTEPRLFAISVGAAGADHSRLFHPSGLDSALSKLRAAYRMVVIDGPPVLESGQDLQLARFVDGVMLIVRPGTLAENIRRATARLDELQARVLGMVMNNC